VARHNGKSILSSKFAVHSPGGQSRRGSEREQVLDGHVLASDTCSDGITDGYKIISGHRHLNQLFTLLLFNLKV